MHVCREMISPIYSVISVPFFTSTRVRKPQPRPRVYTHTLFSWECFFFFPTLGALTGNTSNSLTNSLRLNRWLLHCSPHGHASGSHSYKSILDSTFLSVTLYVCDRTKKIVVPTCLGNCRCIRASRQPVGGIGILGRYSYLACVQQTNLCKRERGVT